MNRRIAISALSVLTTLTLVGGAAFAFFSDTNTSVGNVFATGTMVLQLDDVGETFTSNTVSASLGGSNMAPGTSNTGFISLHNGGTVSMAEVELSANKTGEDSDGNLLEDVLDLTVKTGSESVCTGGTDHTPAIAALVGNGLMPLTLGELIANDYDALPGLTADDSATGGTDEYYMCVTATMKTTAGNEYQGNSVTVDVGLTGNQNASQ